MVKPEPKQSLELRDNLAEFLQIILAEKLVGTLKTIPVETIATELGLNWQSTGGQVQFVSLAREILARRENAPIAQNVVDELAKLAASFDDSEPEPLAGQWSNTYTLRTGERHVIYIANRQEHQLTVYLIGQDRELRKHQPVT